VVADLGRDGLGTLPADRRQHLATDPPTERLE
jgi:hypothetical protein